MRAYDWKNHPLGEPAHWPQSLRTNIQLMLHSGFPMFIWWSDQFYMFHNDAYLPALGKKHPEALGASARDMWPEIWDEVGRIAKGIMANGQAFYAENLRLYLERKGFAEETYWTFSYSPAFDDRGQVAGIFCACTEVTDSVLWQRRLNTLKNMSDALTQVHTLEQTCQATCDLLAQDIHDIPFCAIYLLDQNRTEARRAGMRGAVNEGTFPAAVALSRVEDSEDQPFAKALRTRQPVIIACSPSGEEGPVSEAPLNGCSVIIPVLRSDQEHVLGFFVAGTSPHLEYTESYRNFYQLLAGHIATSIIGIQVREAVKKQQESLNEMFQQAPVGITIVRGPEYVIEMANPLVCEIWGRKQEELLGRPVLEALPEVRDQGIKELLDGVYYTGVPFVANELPVLFERKGKLETVYLNFVYQPLRDAHGAITGIIAVAIDINEQVAARQEIEGMNRELLAINSDLDNFVYAASHDLKAPISNIEGLMQALMDYLPDETLASDTVQQLTQYIQSSIERFKRALTDLTEVAKIQREAGDDVSVIMLEDVVTEVSLVLEPMIRRSGAVIETDFSKMRGLEFSAKNLRSIVYNLLSNALKYSAPDRKPHIRIATDTTPEHLILSVTDNGLGIDKADESKIFLMFKRLHDHVEGSGIGLYIVKRIIENAGGRIEVESELGAGTTFRIYFRR